MTAMEFIVLVLIGFGILVLLSKRIPTHHSRQDWSRPNATPIKRAHPQPRATQRVFDNSTAKPTIEPRVLQGPAYVTDGDTITIAKTQIRLHGIDAPELNHPYGKQAKWALHSLCKGHRIKAEIIEIDVHGRTVAHCYLPDGRDLSAEMVKLGLAIDWAKFSGGKFKHLEVAGVRRKLYLADARQKGRMHVWAQYEARQQRARTEA